MAKTFSKRKSFKPLSKQYIDSSKQRKVFKLFARVKKVNNSQANL